MTAPPPFHHQTRSDLATQPYVGVTVRFRRVAGRRAADAGVRLPKREMLFLDVRQVEQLADAIGPHDRVLVDFLAYTGLRFGEAVALKTKRLDLLRGRCEVVESASEVGSALVWGPTETDERRAVRLPQFLVELLGEHLASRPHGPEDLVFTAPLGGPLRERKFLHGQPKPAARRRCSVPSATSRR